jgi:hypothetical protein
VYFTLYYDISSNNTVNMQENADIFSDNMVDHYMSGSNESSAEMGLWGKFSIDLESINNIRRHNYVMYSYSV